MTEPEVLIEMRGRFGWITLNRPKTINALNHAMVATMTSTLRAWARDDEIDAVVVTGAGERGLCAGGDIVSIYHDARAGGAASRDFWRAEYILNATIARYPKPYVAVMSGLVMGGGVGISAHGSVRIVTDGSSIGMPEVGIGFVPDVGGTYLLARAPGEIGAHVALTTARMSAGDAVAAGFADHYIPAAVLAEFLATLPTTTVEHALDKFTAAAPDSTLAAQRAWIDECYCAATAEGIVARLETHGSPDAAAAADQIRAKSPIAVTVALRSIRRAHEIDSVEQVLNEEYRVSLACLKSHDLVEGIRAQVIDKDRAPRWSPANLREVTDDQVDAYFADGGEPELGLTPPAGATEGKP